MYTTEASVGAENITPRISNYKKYTTLSTPIY